MKLLGRYQGKNGQIEIVECSWDGTRVYFEEGVRQGQATLDGESVFTYVKLMDELLSRSQQILVLGCGGGKLATRLSRLGKSLTVVDINPISFILEHKFFGLPDELPCIVSDFRQFVFDDRVYYDGIAIDLGGPGFRFRDEFDTETCDAILVLALVYWHHMHAARLFLAFIHGCPLGARTGRSPQPTLTARKLAI